MKYFKPDYWLDLQSIESINEIDEQWEISINKYIEQLEGLQPYLSQRNYKFFRYESLHDGYVVNLNIQNRNVLSMKETGSYRNTRTLTDPIFISIEVLSRDYIYTLKFSKVTRFNIDSPEEKMLPGSSGLGDWGYAELTKADLNTFRYEVLFSSGSTILIEFSGFSYIKKRFIK